MFKIISLIGALLIMADFAQAARTLVVAADGTGDFKTIEEAHKAAKAGDTVMIRGNPPETEYFCKELAKISVKECIKSWNLKAISGLTYAADGQTPFRVEIKNVKDVVLSRLWMHSLVIFQSQNIRVEDSSLENLYQDKPYLLVEQFLSNYPLIKILGSQNVSVQRSKIAGSVGSGIQIASMDNVFSDKIVLEENVFMNNCKGGIVFTVSKFEKGSPEIRVIRNSFVANSYDASHCGDSFTDALEPPDYREVVKKGLEARRNYSQHYYFSNGTGIAFQLEGHKNPAKVIANQNIFAYNDAGVIVQTAKAKKKPTVTAEANLFWKNKKVGFGVLEVGLESNQIMELSIQELGKKNISADPLFTNWQSGDLRLAQGSPAAVGGLGAPAVKGE